MRPLLIGMRPGHGDPSTPLAGRCGRRLAQLCDVTYDEYLRLFDRVNLLEEPADGERWPVNAAIVAGDRLIGEEPFRSCWTAVVLGRDVWRALRLGPVPWFDAARLRGTLCYLAPHPSGLSRWWNDLENLHRAEAFWRSFARRATTCSY